MSNFWEKLEKPFFALAPMDGVTDLPFRLITEKYGRPNVVFTEFIPVEALIRGIDQAFIDLRYKESERPIVAQLYGHEPELFYACAQIIAELGFDGVDINMGCPARKIEQRGAGAGLIKTPKVATEIVRAVQAGVKAWRKNGIKWEEFPKEAKVGRLKGRLENLKCIEEVERKPIPVSVKTRVGYDKPDVENWFKTLAGLDLAAISIHGRTLKEAYRGKANWELVKRAGEIIKSINPETLTIGNGDIHSRAQGIEFAKKYGVDGLMVGRAAIGNPWIFSQEPKPTLEKLFEVMLEHARLHYKYKNPKTFVQMRRNLSEYVKGVEGAKELRSKLVRVNTPEDVKLILGKVKIT